MPGTPDPRGAIVWPVFRAHSKPRLERMNARSVGRTKPHPPAPASVNVRRDIMATTVCRAILARSKAKLASTTATNAQTTPQHLTRQARAKPNAAATLDYMQMAACVCHAQQASSVHWPRLVVLTAALVNTLTPRALLHVSRVPKEHFSHHPRQRIAKNVQAVSFHCIQVGRRLKLARIAMARQTLSASPMDAAYCRQIPNRRVKERSENSIDLCK